MNSRGCLHEHDLILDWCFKSWLICARWNNEGIASRIGISKFWQLYADKYHQLQLLAGMGSRFQVPSECPGGPRRDQDVVYAGAL